jgi:hypothetical protein
MSAVTSFSIIPDNLLFVVFRYYDNSLILVESNSRIYDEINDDVTVDKTVCGTNFAYAFPPNK